MHRMHHYAFIMKALTVRNVPRKLADALARERRRRNQSLNQTVLEVLGEGLGLDSPEGRRNGLSGLAGTWTPADLAQFNAAIAEHEQIDDELWK